MNRLLKLTAGKLLGLSVVIWITLSLYFGSYYANKGYEYEYVSALVLGIASLVWIYFLIKDNLMNPKIIKITLLGLNSHASIYSLLMFFYLSGDLNVVVQFLPLLKPIVPLKEIERLDLDDQKILGSLFAIADEPEKLFEQSNEINKLVLKYPTSSKVHTINGLYLIARTKLNEARAEFELAAQYAAKHGNVKGQVENLLYIVMKIDIQEDNHETGLMICNQILAIEPENDQARGFKKYFEAMLQDKRTQQQ